MICVSDKAPTALRLVRRATAVVCLSAVLAFSWTGVRAMVPPIQEVAGISVQVLLGRAERVRHPLVDVVRRLLAGELGEQPIWKFPMLVNGLRKTPLDATITAYTELDPGCTTRTAWGSRVRRGIVAADRRYWGPGSVVWIGPPICETLVVEDVGSAIKGPHRFDVCFPGDLGAARDVGVRRSVPYVALHREPPRGHWSAKPKSWQPPVWKPGIPAPGAEAPAAELESEGGIPAS